MNYDTHKGGQSRLVPLILTCGFFGFACAHSGQLKPHPEARARLTARPSAIVDGTVTFVPVESGVRVIAEVQGLTPNALHGFHIHETGDCSKADFSSAGGHFNPHNHAHAGPENPTRHTGDLGNLQADESGTAQLDRVILGLSVSGDGGILKRSVVIHEKEDDLKSQPAGNSGTRIACGIIEFQ